MNAFRFSLVLAIVTLFNTCDASQRSDLLIIDNEHATWEFHAEKKAFDKSELELIEEKQRVLLAKVETDLYRTIAIQGQSSYFSLFKFLSVIKKLKNLKTLYFGFYPPTEETKQYFLEHWKDAHGLTIVIGEGHEKDASLYEKGIYSFVIP